MSHRYWFAVVVAIFLTSSATADGFQHGLAALRKKDVDLAVASFTSHIRAKPNDAAAYEERGIAFHEKQEYDNAIADFSQAIGLLGTDNRHVLFVYAYRAQAYCDKGEYDKSILDCTKAIRVDPREGYGFFVRATVYTKAKSYAKAAMDFNEAVKFDANNHCICNDFAWLLATCSQESVRDGKRAITLAKMACKTLNQKAQYLDTLAAAYAEDGQFNEAVKWQQKAIELSDPEKGHREKAQQRLKLYDQRKPYRDE